MAIPMKGHSIVFIGKWIFLYMSKGLCIEMRLMRKQVSPFGEDFEGAESSNKKHSFATPI